MRRRLTSTPILTIVFSLACMALLLADPLPSASCPLSVRSCGGEGLEIDTGGGFKPTKLPKNKLAAVHLVLEGSGFLAGPAALKEVVFEIDRNVAFDAEGLAVCRIRPIDFPVEPNPCKGARVGKGEMEFEVAFPETPPFALKSHVVAYSGGKLDGVRTILIRTYLPRPISAAVVIEAKVTKIDLGRYGTKLAATIPVIAGGSASVKEFQLEFFRQFTYRQKKQSFVKARCADGKLQVHGEAIFADGTDESGTFERSCTAQG
jgi:hypothetical protein